MMKVLVLVALLVGLAVHVSAAEMDFPTLPIGASAPDFKLPATDGKTYTLKSFEKYPILVIIFTANHCPTAQAYEERITKMVTDFRSKGVGFVAISPNDPGAVRLDELGWSDLSDSLEEMKLRVEHKKYNFPYLYDGETQEVSKKYGPKATPHVFIFDKQRKLRYTGRIDEDERHPDRIKSPDARNAVEALLKGASVPVETTRTVGCSIKWSDKRESVKQAFAEWAKEEVKLETVNASTIEELLRNKSDKIRLINVWATWCGPCVIEFPELVTMHRMYRHREFELITISADDVGNRDAALAFLKKQQASTRNVIFEGNTYALFEAIDKIIGGKSSSGALPYTLIIKPGGEVQYRREGRIDPLVVKREIIKFLGNTYR